MAVVEVNIQEKLIEIVVTFSALLLQDSGIPPFTRDQEKAYYKMDIQRKSIAQRESIQVIAHTAAAPGHHVVRDAECAGTRRD